MTSFASSLLSLGLFFMITFQSCMMTKTSVGEYKEQAGQEYVYAKGKQMWLFWGLIPMGRTNVNTPKDGNCEVITKYTVGDVLVTVLTAGIVKTYTIKVMAKKPESSSGG